VIAVHPGEMADNSAMGIKARWDMLFGPV